MTTGIVTQPFLFHYKVAVRYPAGPYSAARYLAARIRTDEKNSGEPGSIVVFDRSLEQDKLEETIRSLTGETVLIGRFVKQPISRQSGSREHEYSTDSLGVVFPQEDRDLNCALVERIMDRFDVDEAIIKEERTGALITIRRVDSPSFI